jgi:hypothetical protein
MDFTGAVSKEAEQEELKKLKTLSPMKLKKVDIKQSFNKTQEKAEFEKTSRALEEKIARSAARLDVSDDDMTLNEHLPAKAESSMFDPKPISERIRSEENILQERSSRFERRNKLVNRIKTVIEQIQEPYFRLGFRNVDDAVSHLLI